MAKETNHGYRLVSSAWHVTCMPPSWVSRLNVHGRGAGARMPPRNDTDRGKGTEAEAYEEKNVHEVYQQIAGHFSSTRYKPWPIVERFLRNLTPGAIGLDVGCGNGKYLPVNKSVFIIASDR